MTDDTKIVPITEKRRPPRAGMGRPAGVPNKTTASMREMLLGALEQAGGVDWLAKQANENPTAFMTLLGRLIPADVTLQANVTQGMPTKIIRTIVDPRATIEGVQS
jgi:hypothetical protein